MREEARWRRYLRFWGADPRRDVEDELSFHIAERAALYERAGMTPEQARAEAERKFGDVTRIRSECIGASEREARHIVWAERAGDVVRDVRLAVRSLSRAPVFALTAVAALALGIGASTAMFTVVSAVLLRPLPYGEPERVVAVHNRWAETPRGGISPAEYLDFAERARAFTAFGVYSSTFVNLIEGDVAERVPAAEVTPSVWRALGITPAAGRLFTDAEGARGAEPLVLLSYEFWQSRYHGSHGVIGRELLLNGRPQRVVGVLPAGVRLPFHYHYAEPPAFFFPHRIDRQTTTARGSHFLNAVARLAPGWTVQAANAEASRVAQQFVAEYPDDYPAPMGFDTYVRPIHSDVIGGARPLLLLLVGGVTILLLIACANVASLVLTRTEERRRELAVRSALGAGRWRIARQLLLEQLVLATVAGAAGLVIAYATAQALLVLRPGEIPRLGEAVIDVRVLAFTAGVSLSTALLVALAPLRLGAALQSTLQEAGGRTTATRAAQRARRVLIIAEVALSIVLLAGAGLLLRSFAKLLSVDPGYRIEQVLVAPVSLPSTRYPDNEPRRRFFAQLVSEASRLPGVIAAGAVLNLPLYVAVGDINIQIEGRAVDETDVSPRLDFQVVAPGWFEAMSIGIVRGRGILPSDDARNPGVVVLSESAARKYWADTDPIGKRFELGGNAGPGWVTVVGVVRDIRHALVEPPPPLMYLPHGQFTFWNGGLTPASMTLVLHTAAQPVTLIQPLRDQLRRMDAHVPLGNARPMTEVLRASVAAQLFATSLLVGFAAIALVLAMLGVYGVVGYTVALRSREIAVRMALGAQPRGVVRQMTVQGMVPVVAGLGLGGGAALALTRLLQQQLYGVSPHDPVTLAGALALLCATALAACLIPARRATRVAPLSVLREE